MAQTANALSLLSPEQISVLTPEQIMALVSATTPTEVSVPHPAADPTPNGTTTVTGTLSKIAKHLKGAQLEGADGYFNAPGKGASQPTVYDGFNVGDTVTLTLDADNRVTNVRKLIGAAPSKRTSKATKQAGAASAAPAPAPAPAVVTDDELGKDVVCPLCGEGEFKHGKNRKGARAMECAARQYKQATGKDAGLHLNGSLADFEKWAHQNGITVSVGVGRVYVLPIARKAAPKEAVVSPPAPSKPVPTDTSGRSNGTAGLAAPSKREQAAIKATDSRITRISKDGTKAQIKGAMGWVKLETPAVTPRTQAAAAKAAAPAPTPSAARQALPDDGFEQAEALRTALGLTPAQFNAYQSALKAQGTATEAATSADIETNGARTGYVDSKGERCSDGAHADKHEQGVRFCDGCGLNLGNDDVKEGASAPSPTPPSEARVMAAQGKYACSECGAQFESQQATEDHLPIHETDVDAELAKATARKIATPKGTRSKPDGKRAAKKAAVESGLTTPAEIAARENPPTEGMFHGIVSKVGTTPGRVRIVNGERLIGPKGDGFWFRPYSEGESALASDRAIIAAVGAATPGDRVRFELYPILDRTNVRSGVKVGYLSSFEITGKIEGLTQAKGTATSGKNLPAEPRRQPMDKKVRQHKENKRKGALTI